ncbi:MICOS complex subunit MIC27 isoform X2 [Onychostruthus taczanowskii]|uniref:MICOS complex subunit MIC27 isoform X2 n=1 Tax=Onychostruthus taczanowskii TaxID=356909 RepID=UPI001B80C5DF|nr:MICOS complex subunit MIC27 isoform X2 [Onychostruthus taczanowskii]
MAAKVAKLAAVSSGLPFVCITVYAATEKESKSQLVKPDKLPIYSAPPPSSRYVQEQPGLLQQQLTALRRSTGHYFGWCQSVYVFIKNGIMDSIQFGKDAYVYLNNPPPEFLPKAALITVSGLAGVVLARKGSRFKKIVYPLGLAAVGYSVCYPAQSVVIAKVTGKKLLCASHQTYEAVRSLWADKEAVTKLQQESKPIMQEDEKKKGISSTKPESAVESRSLNRTESLPVECWSNEDPVPSSGTVKTSKFKPDPKLTDHGQSNPEDVDMYSTRS